MTAASTPARRDFELLLGAALPLAQQLLASYGEFFPFAAALDADGVAEMMAGDPGVLGERPAAQEVIEACLAMLVAQRARLRAAAVVSAVATPEGDAVRVDLEHVDGSALAVLVPYATGGEGPEYGPLRVVAGRARVWGPGG
jgi:hypothetical protein